MELEDHRSKFDWEIFEAVERSLVVSFLQKPNKCCLRPPARGQNETSTQYERFQLGDRTLAVRQQATMNKVCTFCLVVLRIPRWSRNSFNFWSVGL